MSESPHIKPEEPFEALGMDGYDEDDGDDGDSDVLSLPTAPMSHQMQPTPAAPPEGLSPSQTGGKRTRRGDVPAFFHNNGLIMKNDEGIVPSNESALPTEKSFTIQVGPETFRLSGASIMSDAPSYFSRFFEAEISKRRVETSPSSNTSPSDQTPSVKNAPIRTLYVDRDPETFRDIALHLQGYHIQPRNSTHYVRLFADAQFYVLPRLIKDLYESDVFIRIGEEEFCIPRDLFDSPGNLPNYFTLGFSLLFSTPGNPFPGLDVSGLLRPPAIKAASASGRSGRIFADILDLLRGYDVHVRDDEHRAALLRDCRYYHLRGLEQQLVPHTISFNQARQISEIILRLEDLRQSGISVASQQQQQQHEAERGGTTPGDGVVDIVRYARPFADDAASPHELIFETGPDSATISRGNNFVVEFHGESRQRVMSLFKVVQSKFAASRAESTLDGSAPQVFSVQEDGMATARIEADAFVTVDGKESWLADPSPPKAQQEPVGLPASATPTSLTDAYSVEESEHDATRKRRRVNSSAAAVAAAAGEQPVEGTREWVVHRAQWRVRVESWSRGPDTSDMSVAVHLYAVNLDVVRGQKGRTRRRGFIGC